MKAKIIGAVVAVVLAGWLPDTARADFQLWNYEQVTVNTAHVEGILWNQSRANIVAGGSVSILHAHDTSTVNMSAGTVSQRFYAQGSSTVTISGGSVGILDAYSSSTVNVSGGTISTLYANDLKRSGGPRIDISSGTVGTLMAAVTLTGDEQLQISEAPTPAVLAQYAVTVAPGTVANPTWHFVYAFDTTAVAISGGSVYYGVFAWNSSTVGMSGGSMERLYSHDSSSVDMTGGVVTDLTARNTSTANISGGTVYELYACGTSTVTFVGKDFILGTGLLPDGDKVLGMGVLSGKWLNGTPWTVTIGQNDAGATILLVPEPATLSLLALGGLAMIRRHRK